MDTTTLLELGQRALVMVLLLSAPAFIVSMMVGLIVSIFQATTQIQEMTLSFVPKIFFVFLVHLLVGAWLLDDIVGFTVQLFQRLPEIVGG